MSEPGRVSERLTHHFKAHFRGIAQNRTQPISIWYLTFYRLAAVVRNSNAKNFFASWIRKYIPIIFFKSTLKYYILTACHRQKRCTFLWRTLCTIMMLHWAMTLVASVCFRIHQTNSHDQQFPMLLFPSATCFHCIQ